MSVHPPEAVVLIETLQRIESAAEFEHLVDQRPELFGERVLGQFEEMDQQPGIEGSGRLLAQLVRDADTNASAAWRRFNEATSRIKERGQQLDGIEDEISAAITEGRFADAETMAAEAFAYADEFGLVLFRAVVHEQIALALFHTAAGDRSRNIDLAIEHARMTLPVATDEEHLVKLTMNLAVMFTARLRGDPAENLEQAIKLLRDTLGRLDRSQPSELLAIIQTNLAHNLELRQRGDRLQNLLEGRDLCLAALRFRSPERDPDNWAYTQINLGSIYDKLAQVDQADPADAEEALRRVIDEAERVSTPRLVGHSHSSLGAIHRAAAERLARDERSVIGPGPPPPPSEAELSHLVAARENLEAALPLIDVQANRELYGRALNDLGGVFQGMGDEEAAIDASRQALDVLGTTLVPHASQQAGSRLGDLLARRGRWDEAAAAFLDALRAHDSAFHARLENIDRTDEAKSMGNLPRWAAFALARSGDAEQAALVLENGRTRELRRRIGAHADAERLDELPAELREAHERAVSQLTSTPIDSASDIAGRELQEVLTAIRQLPGFEDFATGSTWSDIASAVEADWPLVYVDPTPAGTLLLIVFERDGTTSCEAVCLDGPTSHDVFMTLMLGSLDDPARPASYLASVNAHDQRTFPRALEEVLALIGQGIARPLAEHLSKAGFPGATLVLCGPLGLAPVHAASWETDEGPKSLLDLFEIRHAPSALLQATSLQRITERGSRDPLLVAVANPDLKDPQDDLPGCDAETEELGALFRPSARRIGRREDATAEFFLEHAGDATHLHVACHGYGGLLDPEETGLHLTDRRLSGIELTAIELSARLTVLSACQTAVAALTEAPDEVFSLSTAFLGSGSACAIATLWSVDDCATALLMCKLYEEMLQNERPPTEALRHAQLWLRDLSDEEEAEFLAGHPALEAEFRRRREAQQRPGFRGASDSPGRPNTWREGRFSHPQYWAPYVVSGA